MKISIAGKDRTADLGASLQEAARALAASGVGASRLAPADSALALRDSADEGAYLRALNNLIRIRAGIDPSRPPGPPPRGPIRRLASALRRALWSRLRYEQDNTVFQLNVLLRLLSDAIVFQQEQVDAEWRRLRAAYPNSGEAPAAPSPRPEPPEGGQV